MTITRRQMLVGSASLFGCASMPLRGLAQSAAAIAAPPDLGPVPAASTPAAKALYGEIGASSWTELNHRLHAVNADIQAHGLRHIPGVEGTFLTGYPYNEFYDWDLYFENLYLSYYGVWTYCFTNLKEFLNREQPDGYVNRSLIKQRDRQQFKPFLAQLAVLGAKQNHDNYEWLRGNYYDRLVKYIEKWFSYDSDHNGLPVWNSADAAGTDNQWSRGGALGAFEIEGVDLASYLIRELRAMSVIAARLDLKADSTAFTRHAGQVAKLINSTFWDEQQGMYFDRNEKTGKRVYVKSATNFMPLFAGAATRQRAKRMIHEHLLNADEFWLTYPVASYAKTEPDYYQGSHKECNWRGPTWAPTNYMIFQGLRRYGYQAEARELATRLFNMALLKNPVLREYYNAETGEGLGQTRFWGFTALYYGMILESILGCDASTLDSQVEPIVTRELGVAFQA
ncbi:MAG: trehalase family glycosidase [Terracidiphilus sp.]